MAGMKVKKNINKGLQLNLLVSIKNHADQADNTRKL